MKKMFWIGAFISTILCVDSSAGAKWETYFEDAKERALQEGKLILADFSGSDWCGWCIKLDKEVFSKKEFEQFAEENLVLLMVDFPRRGLSSKQEKHNNELKQKYGIQGYPTVLLLDPEGEVLEKTGYRDGGPEPYVEQLKTYLTRHKDKIPEASRPGVLLEPQMRTWTSSSGSTIDAVLQKCENGWVYLKTKEGKEIKIHSLKLSSEDQHLLNEYKKALMR